MKGIQYFINYTAFILFFDAISFVPFAYLRLNNRPSVILLHIKIVNIVVNVSFNFVLVLHFKMGLVSVFIGNVAASAITFILLLPFVIKNLKFKFNKELFNELWKFSIPYVPTALASILVQVTNRPILLLLTDETTVRNFSGQILTLGIFMMLIVSMFDYASGVFSFLNNAREPNA